MKKAIYRLFKPTVYKRALQLRAKQEARLERLNRVVRRLNQWNDIPISWQLNDLCEILRIEPNEKAEHFIYGLNFGRIDVKEEARKLPL